MEHNADEIMALVTFDQKFTSVNPRQTNAACEGFNKESWKISQSLLNLLDLDNWLLVVMLTYNTRVHSSINYSPFFLIYLHQPNLQYFYLNEPQTLHGEDWANSNAVQQS